MEIKGTQVDEKEPTVVEKVEENTQSGLNVLLDLPTAEAFIENLLTPEQLTEYLQLSESDKSALVEMLSSNELYQQMLTQVGAVKQSEDLAADILLHIEAIGPLKVALEWARQEELRLKNSTLPYDSFVTGESMLEYYLRWSTIINTYKEGKLDSYLSKHDINEALGLLNFAKIFIDNGLGELSRSQIAAYYELSSTITRLASVAPDLLLKTLGAIQFTGSQNDEHLLGQALWGLVKSFVKDSDLRRIIVDSPIILNSLTSVLMEGMIGSKFDKALVKYTGAGGFYEKITPIVLAAELMLSFIPDNLSTDIANAYFSHWPYKTSDGSYFLPTSSGVYIYQPGQPGSDVTYFLNLWDGPTNIIIKTLDVLKRSNLPYVDTLATIASLYDNFGGLQSSTEFGLAFKSDPTYKMLISNLKTAVSKAMNKMLQTSRPQQILEQTLNTNVTANEAELEVPVPPIMYEDVLTKRHLVDNQPVGLRRLKNTH